MAMLYYSRGRKMHLAEACHQKKRQTFEKLPFYRLCAVSHSITMVVVLLLLQIRLDAVYYTNYNA